MSTHNLLLTDIPLEDDSGDLFGYKKFTDRLVDSIKYFSSDDGLVVALNGEWGSGKTSVVNIVKNQLQKEENIQVISYSYWWYEGKKEVITAFLTALSTAIRRLGNSDETVSKLSQIMRVLVPVADLITQSNIPGKVLEISERFFCPVSLEENFRSIREFLKKQDSRIVIFIDDLDRMDPDDSIQVFKLLKTIGRLPKVTFVVAYDKELAHSILSKHYSFEGLNFLEKVVQISFDMPSPSKRSLFNIFAKELSESFPAHFSREDFEVLWDECIYPFARTPRNMGRLLANIKFNIRPIVQDICIRDYTLLEILRLRFPKIYSEIAHNKHEICQDGPFQLFASGQCDVNTDFIDFVVNTGVNKDDRLCNYLKKLLSTLLFPAISVSERKKEKRLCSSDHFDTYFNLNIDPESVSAYELHKFVEISSSLDSLKSEFPKLCAKSDIKVNQRCAVFIKELGLHVREIANKELAKQILKNWVQVIDDYYDTEELLCADEVCNIYQLLYYVWTEIQSRFFETAQETNDFISETLKVSSVHWTLQLLDGESRSYEIPYIKNERMNLLRNDLQAKIKKMVSDNELLSLGNQLLFCLFHWNKAFKESEFLSQILNGYLDSDKNVNLIAKAFLSIGIRHPGGLFDVAHEDEAKTYMNTDKFYESVERASKNGYQYAFRFWNACKYRQRRNMRAPMMTIQ